MRDSVNGSFFNDLGRCLLIGADSDGGGWLGSRKALNMTEVGDGIDVFCAHPIRVSLNKTTALVGQRPHTAPGCYTQPCSLEAIKGPANPVCLIGIGTRNGRSRKKTCWRPRADRADIGVGKVGLPTSSHLPHPDHIGPHPFPRTANSGVAGFAVRLRGVPTQTIDLIWFDVLIRGAPDVLPTRGRQSGPESPDAVLADLGRFGSPHFPSPTNTASIISPYSPPR